MPKLPDEDKPVDNSENQSFQELVRSAESAKDTVLKKLWEFIRRLPDFLEIKSSTAPEATIKNIDKNIAIKGYNVWILVCSALLASIGLDTNSTAVIIGAMLISPLMSPILGVGLGVGIRDRSMLVHSLENLLLATVSSLIASFVYFLFTPLGDPTSEIMARTYPTLLDVCVALFGGVAGIISGSRNEQTNAIPGVAIATALMPPLCTAGFGLATWRFDIFFGAFYLYFINAVFISFSTFVMVKYLEFERPKDMEGQEMTERDRKTVQRVMIIAMVLVIIPTSFFLYNLWNKTQKIQQIERLTKEITEELIQDDDHEVLSVERPKTMDELKKVRTVKMYVSGDPIEDSVVEYYRDRLQKIGNYKLLISTLNNVSQEEIEQITVKTTQNNILELKTKYEAQNNTLKALRKRQDSIQFEQKNLETDKTLLEELRVFFPQIKDVEVLDKRTLAEQAASRAKSDSLNTDSLKNRFRLELTKTKTFPYTKITTNRAKAKKDLQLPWEIVASRLFPYLNFDLPDTMKNRLYTYKKAEKFPYITLAVSQKSLEKKVNTSHQTYQSSHSTRNKEEEEQNKQLIPIDAVITLYNDKNIVLRKEDSEKIYNFLSLKLHTNIDTDTLILNFEREIVPE